MTANGSTEVVVGRLRLGLLGLAAAGVAGTAFELASLRHWKSGEQMIPWVALAAVAVAIVAVGFRPSGLRVRLAQLLAVATLGSALFGVFEHVKSNLDSGPLDATYGPRWATMGMASRWWAAATGGVGPSPTLAPAVLVQISLCLLLATLAHPALSSSGPRSTPEP